MRTNTMIIAALAAVGLAAAAETGRRRRHASHLRGHLNGHLDRLELAARRHAPTIDMPTAAAIGAVAALAAAGWFASRQLRHGPGEANTVEESIELDVPVSTAYNQWTQFEEFPKFMASVQSVDQIDDTHLRWRAVVGGKVKEWEAEITEQIPDKRIAWRSTGGVANSGVVTFHKITDTRTRVMLQMDYRPESMLEKAGDVGGAVKLTTKGNLKRFKKMLETRGRETGAWRGNVQQH
ncbi:MAG: SRPBCC family protein [Ramlibacter sp.]|jgi:uncharacterized membrane protein